MSKTIVVSDETYELIKEQVEKDNKEFSKTKIQIKSLAGELLFEGEKTMIEEAIVEAVEKGVSLTGAYLTGAYLTDANLVDANLVDANLVDANLVGADLRDVDFYKANFYGKDGNTKIKKSQVDDFFKALGVVVED